MCGCLGKPVGSRWASFLVIMSKKNREHFCFNFLAMGKLVKYYGSQPLTSL
jgi:hypothetical protein